MVDCGSSRCAQDRRVLKKELLTWTKKVPILLGLEQIAERYTKRHAFRHHMESYKSLEPAEPEDWSPSTTCCFCQSDKSKQESRAETPKDEQETERFQTETEACPTHDYYPHYLPVNYHPPLPLDDPLVDSNKPLDLSASAQTHNHGNHGGSDHDNQTLQQASQPLVELKVPQVTNKVGKKKDMSGKRSYTEDDLSSAVNDIRSGKLGTRRAAALYGIPRSTLRNKIFRMESENTYEPPCSGNLSMSDLLQNMANNEAAKNEWKLDDWEQRLDLLRRKHDLNAGLDRPFGMPPLFFSNRHIQECEKAFAMSSPFDYEVKLPFLHELVRKFAEHRMEAERAQCMGLPFLSELMQGMPGCSMPGAQGLMPGSMANGPVQLKIPSYKPIRSYGNSSEEVNGDMQHSPLQENDVPSPGASASNKINDTLKDIIAKNIAEKVRSRTAPMDGDFAKSLSCEAPSPSMNCFSVKNKRDLADDVPPQTVKKVKRDSKVVDKPSQDSCSYEFEPQEQNPTEDTDGKTIKKTRPKRGQYRKYNSQLLLEAVRAVQRGEMSVHRAGSYFGVPHSTLEYKVKERHLMRQKKPRETKTKKSASASGTTSSTKAAVSDLNIPTPGSNSSIPNIDDKLPLKGTNDFTYDADDDLEPGEIPTRPLTITAPDIIKDHSLSSSQDTSPASSVAMEAPRPDVEPLNHSVSSLLSAAAMGGLPLPGAPPGLPNFYMGGALPMGFGWPPLIGGLPLGLPDPAMAAASACLPGYSINLSASDLLKKLQRKVQAQASPGSTPQQTQPGSAHDPTQSLQGNHGNGSNNSQVIVK